MHLIDMLKLLSILYCKPATLCPCINLTSCFEYLWIVEPGLSEVTGILIVKRAASATNTTYNI